MSESTLGLRERMLTRIRQLLRRANMKTSLALPRLHEFSLTENLPWDPRLPILTADQVHLLRGLCRELNDELACEEVISDRDVLHFALEELQAKFRSSARADILSRLSFHLWNDRQNKIDPLT